MFGSIYIIWLTKERKNMKSSISITKFVRFDFKADCTQQMLITCYQCDGRPTLDMWRECTFKNYLV